MMYENKLAAIIIGGAFIFSFGYSAATVSQAYAQDNTQPAADASGADPETTTAGSDQIAPEVVTTPAVVAPEATSVVTPPDNTWTIPAGQMITGGTEVFKGVISMVFYAALGWASLFLPRGTQTAFKMIVSKFGETFITNITDYAVNATKNATKGAKLNIPVGSEVIARAAEYATASGWAWLINYLGGIEGVKQKVFRKIDMEPNATEVEVGIKPVTTGVGALLAARLAARTKK